MFDYLLFFWYNYNDVKCVCFLIFWTQFTSVTKILEVFMKKITYVLVLMLISITMIFSGCGAKGFKNNPSASDLVIGNGGLVVQQGDYLYFANGKDSYNNAAKDMTKGGLY